jgi:hypothetical protein
MNWDKVKNILIIILVLLNGFLFISMQESGAKRETDAKINEYVFTVLEERGITITCEVPDISGSTKIVHFGQAGFDKERVLSVLLDLEGPFEPTQTQFENNEKKVVFINPGFSHFYFTDSSKKTEQVLDIHQKSAVKKYVLDYLESIGVEWSDHIGVGNTHRSFGACPRNYSFRRKSEYFLRKYNHRKKVLSEQGACSYLRINLKIP